MDHFQGTSRPSNHENVPTPVVAIIYTTRARAIENWKKRAKEKKKQGGVNLQFALRHHVQMYPTPRACDLEGVVKNVDLHNGSFSRKNKKGVRYGVKLKDAVHHLEKMYPTPRATAAMTENLDTVKKRVQKRGKLGAKLEET